MHNIIVQHQKLTLLSSLFDMEQMIALAKYYDMQMFSKFNLKIFLVGTKKCPISQYKI